jgi:hypothetical protein
VEFCIVDYLVCVQVFSGSRASFPLESGLTLFRNLNHDVFFFGGGGGPAGMQEVIMSHSAAPARPAGGGGGLTAYHIPPPPKISHLGAKITSNKINKIDKACYPKAEFRAANPSAPS